LLAALSVVVGVVRALDKYYWVICPVLFVSGIAIPGLPFSGRELGCLILIGVYFVRQALHKEQQIKLNRKVFIAFPVFFWICVVWMLNPTGMAILGAETIGARFYFQIVLGFFSLLVLSSFRLNERDCRILFYAVTVSCGFEAVLTFIHPMAGMFSSEGDEIEMDGRMSRYEFLGAMSLYVLMFSRYRLSEILSSLWKLLLVLVFAALTIYSGKRRGFGTLIVVPVLRTFFTGRDKLSLGLCSVVGALLVAFAVAGDGALWNVPLSVRRSLSVVVPQYATGSAMGVTDVFRREVQRYGREVIRENPWFGRKGFSMDRGTTSWIIGRQGMGETTFSGHAYAGNWHSTWYAFAADFGLPAMFLWGLFMFFVLVWTYRGFNIPSIGVYPRAVYLYYAFGFYTSAIFSYTSGHSAQTALYGWFTWGFLIALQNGMRDRALACMKAEAA
jgi:hypothetical protein